MRVLVTGGLGFLGSFTAEKLVEKGHEVCILDAKYTNKVEEVPGAECYDIDITWDLTKFASIPRVDVVVHFAGQTKVVDSMRNPHWDFKQNVYGTMQVLRFMEKRGIERIIFASTSAVYGDPKKLCVNEEDPTEPASYYGLSKSIAEQYLLWYWKLGRIEPVIFRYFNIYGPRKPDNVIGIFSKCVVENKPLPVRGNGDAIRDYVYIDDVVELNLKAIEDPKPGIYNVGSGKPTKLRDLVELFGREYGVKYVPLKPGEIQGFYADITKVKKVYGFRPKTELREGIRKVVEFCRRCDKDESRYNWGGRLYRS